MQYQRERKETREQLLIWLDQATSVTFLHAPDAKGLSGNFLLMMFTDKNISL